MAILCVGQTRAEQSGRAGDWLVDRSVYRLSVVQSINYIWLFDIVQTGGRAVGQAIVWLVFFLHEIHCFFFMLWVIRKK